VYDRGRNQYSTLAHNQSAEEAQRLVEWNAPLMLDCSLIELDQPRKHRELSPEDCRACRKIVARSANLTPQPEFIRRKQS
jgi:hypothetical protein